MGLRQACIQKKKESLLQRSPPLPGVARGREGPSEPVAVDHPYPTPKTNKTKRNMDFSGKEEEAPTQGKNVLNLPYSDSEEEEGQEVDLTKQVAAEHEDFPSPTPREGEGEPVAEASSSKPRSQRINQLLGKVYELEVLEREIKRTNARLTKKNSD